MNESIRREFSADWFFWLAKKNGYLIGYVLFW